MLRYKQPHSVGKFLTCLDGLGNDHKALFQSPEGIVRAFNSQSRQTALKHFRDVSYVVFGLHDQRLQRPFRTDAKRGAAECPVDGKLKAKRTLANTRLTDEQARAAFAQLAIAKDV